MNTFSTQQISDRVSGELVGRKDLTISGVERLDAATPCHIGFVRDAKYAGQWAGSRAGAVLVGSGSALAPGADRAVIRVTNIDDALVLVLEMFQPPVHRPGVGVHDTAVVDGSASIGAGASIGPGCVIGPHARVGKGTVLHANVVLGASVVVGECCELSAGVVVGDRCELGDHTSIHPGTVIGADGFGYLPVPDGSGLRKIPHIGSVRIGHHVEIGANSCVDRGKFSATTIGDGTKIDNLCQIAHNCRIGRSCILAGQVALGGGVTLEDQVVLGGRVAVVEQLTIGAGAKIGACACVIRDVPQGATWWGTPAQDLQAVLRQEVTLRKLPGLLKDWRKKSASDKIG